MSNFCINLENGHAFVYEQTLESQYLQGSFGAVPNLYPSVKRPAQFAHHSMKIVAPRKLATELRELADNLEDKSNE